MGGLQGDMGGFKGVPNDYGGVSRGFGGIPVGMGGILNGSGGVFNESEGGSGGGMQPPMAPQGLFVALGGWGGVLPVSFPPHPHP